jgi:hypothetical protein
MKHLKTYKTFETIGYSEMTDEIWNDISDILLELEDVGFQITKDIADVKKVSDKLCSDVVEIVIDKKNSTSFSFSEIEEPIRRLIHYMSGAHWMYSLLYFGKFEFVEFESGDGSEYHEISRPYTFTRKYDQSIEFINLKIQNTLKTDAEKFLHKSLVDKIINDCRSFKIAFYQSIDRIIEK